MAKSQPYDVWMVVELHSPPSTCNSDPPGELALAQVFPAEVIKSFLRTSSGLLNHKGYHFILSHWYIAVVGDKLEFLLSMSSNK